MNRAKRNWLIAGIVLIVVGVLLFGAAMAIQHFDFRKLNTWEGETRVCFIQEDFTDVRIRLDTQALELIPSEDGECRVIFTVDKKANPVAVASGGVLVIQVKDERKWYERIGISVGEEKVTLCLPKERYESLTVETDTGSVRVPGSFSFREGQITGDTGSVRWEAPCADRLEIALHTGAVRVEASETGDLRLRTTTGSILARGMEAKAVHVEADTGDVVLEDLRCASLEGKTDTGELTLRRTVADAAFDLHTDTGDVRLDDCDAAELTIRTNTGDVTGTLRTAKVFFTKTNTGDVDVPRSAAGGPCDITTDTGDIRIDLA